jgi:hypothetical protein
MGKATAGNSGLCGVKSTVRFSDDSPAAGVNLLAFARDLRCEQELGQSETYKKGLLQDPVFLTPICES